MRIAVTSKGKTLDSEMDQAFGRAKGFVLVDTDSGEVEFVENQQNVNAIQGAGIQAAGNVSQHDVEFVISGHCGPKAFRTLSAAGIKVIIGVDGTVANAIEKFKEGKLSPVEKADVEEHWV